MVDPYGTRFVGRAAELERLATLRRSGARLVTVVGPPGIGKSRLALLHAASEDGCGGAALDLAEAGDGDVTLRVRATIEALPPEPASGAVGLILDNADYLAADVAGAIPVWLAASPRLVVLVARRAGRGPGGGQPAARRPDHAAQPRAARPARPQRRRLSPRARRRPRHPRVASCSPGDALSSWPGPTIFAYQTSTVGHIDGEGHRSILDRIAGLRSCHARPWLRIGRAAAPRRVRSARDPRPLRDCSGFPG